MCFSWYQARGEYFGKITIEQVFNYYYLCQCSHYPIWRTIVDFLFLVVSSWLLQFENLFANMFIHIYFYFLMCYFCYHLKLLQGEKVKSTVEIEVIGTPGFMQSVATHVKKRLTMGKKACGRVKERFLEYHMSSHRNCSGSQGSFTEGSHKLLV